jgi:GDP-L-fucose synthase
VQIKLAHPFSLAGKKVWVAGHTGMVGSATVRRLARENCDVLTADHSALELRDQSAVSAWINQNKPDVVVLAAATVGGILANSTRPAEFIYDNLAIETNIINASYQNDVEKLLFLGSACIYPREAAQPMNEEALLTGPLEPTNEWYAIAKIAGIKLCEAYRKQYGCDYISAQPNNLYGPGDNFDLQSSHVIPALMVKAHIAKLAGAKSMEIWGTGSAMREFLHVDDLADALVHLLHHYSGDIHINIGTGEEISVRDLATTIAGVVGFEGDLAFDTSKPDGAPRKLLDAARMQALDWTSAITLSDGLASTYDWYLKNIAGAQTA